MPARNGPKIKAAATKNKGDLKALSAACLYSEAQHTEKEPDMESTERRSFTEVLAEPGRHYALVTRRKCLAGLGAMLLAPLAARAQLPYPNGRPVNIVAGYAPGSTSDIVGRLVADRLTAAWGVPVTVENLSGANGNIANERVAKGPADGRQLLIMTFNLATNQFLYRGLSYDPERDFIPISCVARLPNLLVVRKGLPVNSVAELIDYAKANPGKLNCGSPGVGSSIHLAAEIFKRMTGAEMAHVVYRGSGPALNDLAAGNIDLMFDNITSSINLARSGQIRALAVTSAQKTPLAQEFPTVAETVPGFDVVSFHGVGVRAGTPPEIVAKIERDVIALSKEPLVKERLASIAAEVVGSTAADFTRFLAQERLRWGAVIKQLDIRLD
jgi:tripartite-type tricarboxylate transporter receptor subunit TctC